MVSTSASPFKLAGVKMAAPLSQVLVSGDEGSGSDLVSGQVTAANRACDSSIIALRGFFTLDATRSFRLGGKRGR